jgi:putative two-component system response regulator
VTDQDRSLPLSPLGVSAGAVDVLVVDDEAYIREILSRFLVSIGCSVRTAPAVPEARNEVARALPTLVFLDINMPGPSGLELLEELAPRYPETAVIMSTAVGDIQTAMKAIRMGAADYVHKPMHLESIRFVVSRALERRQLILDNREYQSNLESLVEKRTEEVRQKTMQLVRTQAALVRGLCRLTEFRDPETGEHLDRMARYAHVLAEHVERHVPGLPDDYPQLVYLAAPLHDIGKVGVPDSILLKPAALTDSEYEVIKRHTTIGGDIIQSVKNKLDGHHANFLDVGEEVCYGHHERWDGGGYPAGIAGDNIPLSARIATIADYFDACTTARVYRSEPIPFDYVSNTIIENSGRAFDPVVVQAFVAQQRRFHDIMVGTAQQWSGPEI